MNKYKGILIVGPMGAGKDVLAEAFQTIIPGVVICKLGKAIREDVDKEYPELINKRRMYQAYGQQMRAVHGDDYWNDRLWKDIMSSAFIDVQPFGVIADGRQVNEVAYWQAKDFLTIGITAPERTRKDRLYDRDGYIPADDNFLHDTELQACYAAVSLCDIHVENAGDRSFLESIAKLICNRFELPVREDI